MPRPVVRPMRARISWIAAISGKQNSIPSTLRTRTVPGPGISGDAAGVVVGGAGSQSRAEATEQALVRGAARGAAQGDAGRRHGNPPVISVGIGYSAGAVLGPSEDWSAAAGLRARVFRGLRHLIRLLIDTVLDLRTIPAQSLLRIASSNVRMSR
jgi:hypothetical protein